MTAQDCKIFVAAYTENHALVVFAEPELVNYVIGIVGPMIADVMDGQKPPSDGLWMFEGSVDRDPSSPLSADDTADLRYTGVWRRPTESELAACAIGENPCLEPC